MSILACRQCGREFAVKPYRAISAKFCSVACRADHDRGRPVKPDVASVYRRTKTSGKPRLAHRVIVEARLGRRLSFHEYVHHVNGDKHDNQPENLEVVSAKEHAARHGRWKHPRVKRCELCGREFEPHPTKRARAKTCSQECRHKLVSLKERKPEARYSRYRTDAPPSVKVQARYPQVAQVIAEAVRDVMEATG